MDRWVRSFHNDDFQYKDFSNSFPKIRDCLLSHNSFICKNARAINTGIYDKEVIKVLEA